MMPLDTPPAIVRPERDSTKTVVVSVTETEWTAEYKGRRTSWPRTMTADEVKLLAGLWGGTIDTPTVTYAPQPLLPRLFNPPVIPALCVGNT
jgi:hypothetical protein